MQGILNKCHSPVKLLCKIVICCTDKSKNLIKPTTLFLVNTFNPEGYRYFTMFSSKLLLLDISSLVEAYQGQAVQDLLHPRLKSNKKNLKIKWPGTSFVIAWENKPTFGNATTGFPAKWCLRNEHRNSILMMRHYPDLSSASDWLNQISHMARPIRSTDPCQKPKMYRPTVKHLHHTQSPQGTKKPLEPEQGTVTDMSSDISSFSAMKNNTCMCYNCG